MYFAHCVYPIVSNTIGPATVTGDVRGGDGVIHLIVVALPVSVKPRKWFSKAHPGMPWRGISVVSGWVNKDSESDVTAST